MSKHTRISHAQFEAMRSHFEGARYEHDQPHQAPRARTSISEGALICGTIAIVLTVIISREVGWSSQQPPPLTMATTNYQHGGRIVAPQYQALNMHMGGGSTAQAQPYYPGIGQTYVQGVAR